MQKGILVILLLLLLPLTSATLITVKTLPASEVYISTWVPDGTQISAPMKQMAGIDGIVTYNYDDSKSPFEVLVITKYLGEQKYRERFGPYTTGETIETIELLPDDYVDPLAAEETEIQAETIETNNTETNETVSNSTDVEIPEQVAQTGNVVADSFSSKIDPKVMTIIYYAVGAIFVLGVIAAFVVTISRSKKKGKEQYGMQQVKLKAPPKGAYQDSNDLEKIESEIHKVDKEIELFKKRNMLTEAEKRLEEKKRYLDRLKGGNLPRQESQFKPKDNNSFQSKPQNSNQNTFQNKSQNSDAPKFKPDWKN